MASRPDSVRERIVNIGADGNVVGIAIDPDWGSPRQEGALTRSRPEPDSPTVIFLNAGVLHRVGPHRLHVTLARLLASAGFSSLRIDLSGVGDSLPVAGALSLGDSPVADTRAAMDQLQNETGARRFILFGLCSGAENALATALRDDRVVGLLLLDPPCYPTWRSRLRKLSGRIRTLATLKDVARWSVRVATRRLSRLRIAQHHAGAAAPNEVAELSEQNHRLLLPSDEYGRHLSELLNRRVKILCVYSGGNDEGYNHQDQLFEVLPALRGRLDVRYFPAANHVFTERAARERLIECVIEWCCNHLGPGRS
jgi:pimeloyl-ACP methyl ester carboxylesterase